MIKWHNYKSTRIEDILCSYFETISFYKKIFCQDSKYLKLIRLFIKTYAYKNISSLKKNKETK